MIPIYICEDDHKQLEVISAVIKNRIMIENLDSYVHIATSSIRKNFLKQPEIAPHLLVFTF